MKRQPKTLTTICMFFILQGQAHIEVGNASYYSMGFNGRATASGERFNSNAMTAAHRWLPFGTLVRVLTCSKPERFVIVRINDRGPFARGRVIDLSKAAFSKLGNPAQGVLCVKLTIESERIARP